MISFLLNQSLCIQRQQITPDASGGSVRSFTQLLANVPCAVEPASAAVVGDYARRDMIVDVRIFTTANLDALLSGGVKLGDRLTDGSVYYLVKAVKKLANAAICNDAIYEIDCERISAV